jgi:hypothetical protein
MPFARPLCALAIASCLTMPAHAKVESQSATGFVVAHEAEIAVNTQAAYDAFLRIGSWWSSDHSFSGDAQNISIEDGCWCERLPGGGFVRHMTLIHAAPGARLVFSGGLGPLQSMGVAGSLSVRFAAKGDKTQVTFRYAVGGYDAGDFAAIAKGVDGVLGAQFTRYVAYASSKP